MTKKKLTKKKVAKKRRSKKKASRSPAPAAPQEGLTLLAQADNIESGCRWIPDDSADLAVFSPPYFERDGATPNMLRALGALLARVLKPGARAFAVIGQISEAFERPFEMRQCIVEGAQAAGGYLHTWQTIAWVKSMAANDEQKGHYQPINSPNILNYGWEFVFQFSKGLPEEARPLDRLSIGVPYTDKSNLDRGTRGKNGDLHCAGDAWWWFIPYSTTGKTTKKAHRHAYPEALVEKCIKVAGLDPGSAVLDPFIGGGTTADVARSLGHNVIAVDAEPGAIKALVEGWPGPEAAPAPLQEAPQAPAPAPQAAPPSNTQRRVARRRAKRISATDGFM